MAFSIGGFGHVRFNTLVFALNRRGLAQGEAPAADESMDALEALNMMQLWGCGSFLSKKRQQLRTL